jgi:hypothetical protein
MKPLLLLMAMVLLLSGCALSITATPLRGGANAASLRVPASKDDCKNGGWQSLARQDGSAFNNQGACVSYVEAGG